MLLPSHWHTTNLLLISTNLNILAVPFQLHKHLVKSFRSQSILFTTTLVLTILSCKEGGKWKGQAPIEVVETYTLPIQKQQIGTFDLGNGIFATNDFPGARLNGVVQSNDTLITALITSENTPINPSPWYAFKIWSETSQQMHLKITYQVGANHRYYPKLSYDGLNWAALDSSRYTKGEVLDIENNSRELPTSITMKLDLKPDTLWISAQELITSQHVKSWIDELAQLPYVSTTSIGESREKRSIHSLKIGNSDDKKMIMVISRQHPPEVTGYLAMKPFIEVISGDSELAEKFRSEFNTYVVPLANPDGVDNGHWRHSVGGIDLNRDWANFNQPETTAISEFLNERVAANNGKFYFGVDFHSTWEDIYYTSNPELKGNAPGLVPKVIEQSTRDIPGYEPNIRPGKIDGPRINSSSYFFHQFGAESLTFENGDDTPRELLKTKGKASAEKLMELLLEVDPSLL